MLTAVSERETDDQLEGSAISLHRLKSAWWLLCFNIMFLLMNVKEKKIYETVAKIEKCEKIIHIMENILKYS